MPSSSLYRKPTSGIKTILLKSTPIDMQKINLPIQLTLFNCNVHSTYLRKFRVLVTSFYIHILLVKFGTLFQASKCMKYASSVLKRTRRQNISNLSYCWTSIIISSVSFLDFNYYGCKKNLHNLVKLKSSGYYVEWGIISRPRFSYTVKRLRENKNIIPCVEDF